MIAYIDSEGEVPEVLVLHVVVLHGIAVEPGQAPLFKALLELGHPEASPAQVQQEDCEDHRL